MFIAICTTAAGALAYGPFSDLASCQACVAALSPYHPGSVWYACGVMAQPMPVMVPMPQVPPTWAPPIQG